MNIASPNSQSSQISTLQENDGITRLKEHVARIKTLEASVYQEENAYRTELAIQKRQNQCLLGTALDPPSRIEAVRKRDALDSIEKSRPVRVPFLLWAALGSANLMLPDRERLRYKASYERFKVFVTITHLVISILLLLMQGHYWFDSVSNFILVYAYSTMTLRENILQLNGSTMHPWWVWHHYLCICLAGTLLLWPITPVYTMVRKQLLLFMVYIAAVQVLQYRYQMNRLYTLRALSRVNAMRTTTDSASVHVSNSLAFLLPFLLAGHALQFYNAYTLISLSLAAGLFPEWHAALVGVLFFVIGAGNLGTTLWTLYMKRRRAITNIKRD